MLLGYGHAKQSPTVPANLPYLYRNFDLTIKPGSASTASGSRAARSSALQLKPGKVAKLELN